MTVSSTRPKNWIFIRGLIRSKFHWGNFPELFKTQLNAENVECIEVPGNGYSSEQITPELIDVVISELRKQVSFKSESFGIVGISLGGMLATKWAQLYPDEVSHLVLINSSSSLSPFYKRLNPTNYAGIIKNLAIANPAAMEKFVLNATSNNKEIWLPLLKDYTDFQKKHPVSLNNFIQQLKLTSQVDFLNTPKSKNLVLTSKADRLVSYECSESIAEAWKSKIYYHDSAGHDLPLDDANWVIKKIKEFNL
ncbi:MAG: alpha/beta hydrolase [Pseudobdellovibrio sp.]